MSSWAESYIGLIFQVYGLAFFVLGVAALMARRQEDVGKLTVHLGWLAAFGMLHGLQEFVDGERLGNPASWLVVVSSALMVSSFAALMEFGRRLWNMHFHSSRLAALLLYVLTGLGTVGLMLVTFSVQAGLELGARYLLGTPGALLAGVGLLAHARVTSLAPDTRVVRLWLHVVAFAMLGYAALTLLVSPASGELLANWLPTTADFLATTGLPVQLVRTLCAVLLALGFVIITQRSGTITVTTLRRVSGNLNGFVYRARNDQNWSVNFITEGCETLTGYSADAFLRGEIAFASILHPDDEKRVWDEVQAALASRRGFQLEYRLLDRAGVTHWCYEDGRGVFNSQGELQFLEGYVRDDGARHQDRQALRRERDFATQLLDTAPVIILLLDPRGLIQHVNPYFETLTGFHLDEIKGKEWFATLLPERDQARIRELFQAAVQDQPVRGNVNAIVTRYGEERVIEWQAVALQDADGQLSGVLSIGADVTERMQFEAQLRELNHTLEQRVTERTMALEGELQRNAAILSTTIEGFFAADASGRIRQANPAFCALLGYEEAELQALTILDIEAAETPEETAAHIQKIMAQGHDRFDSQHYHKDGSTIEVEISVSLVNIGEKPWFYAFVRDIRPRKIAEATLRQARDEAERANAAKSEFLSRMSHELRTPLNAILGFTQLLQLPTQHSLNVQQADHVEEIRHAGEHLLGLVNEVLDLARIESGQIEINVEPVALGPLIDHCVAQIAPLAAQRSIEFRLELGEPLTVWADPSRLKQVLLNLLSNAVKYNREGGRIQLVCALAGQYVCVKVHDTGWGLSSEQQAQLFKPFERLESAYEGIEGTGIGLALAKKLVEGMQGRIGVDSLPGEGSTFWFELPLSDEEVCIDAPVVETGSGPVPAERETRHQVLYVEDNPANLRLVEKILARRADIELLTSSTAEEGLALAQRQYPALILLDINLPGMNGFEALRSLRDNPATREIPVIAVTANAMMRDVERGKQAGFVDYITKPIHVGTFLDSINYWLGQKSNSKE